MKILTISMFKWCNKQFSSKRFSKNILITLLVIFITTQKFYAVFMISYAVRQFLWKLIILCSLGALTETSHKPLKVEAAKKSFPGVYIIDTTCFDECFLFHVMTGRYYFQNKSIVTQRLVQRPCYWVLVTSVLKEVRILYP